ncbi:DUF1059 domain-containing protein [Rathayibacter sp. CAU 1779]
MQVVCPCGAVLEGESEDEVVEATREHLRDAHPGREYTREQILFFAE